MTKISQLSTAGTITGNETIPIVQGGQNLRVGIGAAQVLESFGAFPDPPGTAGRLAFGVDASGGAGPIFSDGTNWRRVDNRNQSVPVGKGIWIVFACAIDGPALADKVRNINVVDYWISYNGAEWIPYASEIIADNTHFFLNSAYANGYLIASGNDSAYPGAGSFISGTADPGLSSAWSVIAPPTGYEGTAPGAWRNVTYDNPTFTFHPQMLNGDSPSIVIANGAPASAAFNDPQWPSSGVQTGGTFGAAGRVSATVAGVGSDGVMEVRIVQEPLVGLWNQDQLIPVQQQTPPQNATTEPFRRKVYETCWLEYKRPGSPEWRPVQFPKHLGGFPSTPASQLVGGSQLEYDYAGRLLKGLVWGVFFGAVRFESGSN